MLSAFTAEAKTTHGQSKTPVYKVWHAMRQRCEDSSVKNYADYGGRGIKVCERWGRFENFIADMGPRPDGMSLDRIDNDGDYEPSNCRWATRTEQNRNSRRNKSLSFGGETLCIAAWAEKTGIDEASIRQRLAAGWPIERTLTEAVKQLPRRGVEFNGRTQGVAEWCRELGLPLATIRTRMTKGWSAAEAFTRPIRPKKQAA